MLGSEVNQSFGKGGVEPRGAAPPTGSSSSGWQPSQDCDGRGVVVAASNLKVLGREEMDPPQDFPSHRLEG